MIDLDDLLNILDGEDFEERPVEIEEFVQSEKYLGLPPLSDYQYQMIKASSQIYKIETLTNLYGEEKARKRFSQTYQEVIFQLGKGSGKDYVSTIACSYIVYLLLCLRDPARYYGKPPGDNIDILNIAINAEQAKNVFFKRFSTTVKGSPWFEGKYNEKQGHIAFNKNVNVYSGHSERESFEGYNCLYVVLDEISGFALEGTAVNSDRGKTAQALYDMYRASVDSRFAKFGKLVLLSFPRFKNDFIQQRYNDVAEEKQTIMREHEFIIDHDSPADKPGNKFTIEWEEDHIIAYKYPGVYALKRPTWEVNPIVDIEDLKTAFMRDPIESLSRFACMPPEAVDGLFKDAARVKEAFAFVNNITEVGSWRDGFVPDPEKKYFLHVDLAKKHDRAAVSMSHVERFVQKRIGTVYSEVVPEVVVDFVRWWEATPTKEIEFAEIREFIIDLKRKGFNISRVTFDQWQSEDMRSYLESVGLKTDKLSVGRNQYDDLVFLVHDQRVFGPNVELLIEELLRLRIMANGTIDHPRHGGKDLADAVTGAVYNAVKHTPRELNEEITIRVISDYRQPELNMPAEPGTKRSTEAMPQQLQDFFKGLELI